MAVNSKKKGNRYENSIAKRFSEHFNDEFRRTPSSGALVGGNNRVQAYKLREDAQEIFASDVIAPPWFKFLIETKDYADDPKFHHIVQGHSSTLDKWLATLTEDAAFAKKMPLLVFKLSRKGEFACVRRATEHGFLLDFDLPDNLLIYRGNWVIMPLDDFLAGLGDSYHAPQ